MNASVASVWPRQQRPLGLRASGSLRPASTSQHPRSPTLPARVPRGSLDRDPRCSWRTELSADRMALQFTTGLIQVPLVRMQESKEWAKISAQTTSIYVYGHSKSSLESTPTEGVDLREEHSLGSAEPQPTGLVDSRHRPLLLLAERARIPQHIYIRQQSLPPRQLLGNPKPIQATTAAC